MLDGETTMLQLAMLAAIEELAQAVDQLSGDTPHPSEDEPRGFGSV